jgi:hypothetical protein
VELAADLASLAFNDRIAKDAGTANVHFAGTPSRLPFVYDQGCNFSKATAVTFL